MREQGIFSAFTYSLSLHVLIVVITGIIARHSHIYKLPSPYIVSLVDVSGASINQSSKTGSSTQEAAKKIPAAEPEVRTDVREEHDKSPKVYDSLVSERISALMAKKKIEKIVALRKIVDVGSHKKISHGTQSASAKNSQSGAGGSSPGKGDYYSLIESIIRQQWVFPESLTSDLEAIISIRIAKDGGVAIDRIEKTSGNILFDRSVLRAITKASPLPPPPQEMDIGVRFRP